MRLILTAILLLLGMLNSGSAAGTWGSDYVPTPPAPFPAAYQDYQILPGTVSPDGKHAFIYPRHSLFEQIDRLDHLALYLVTLRPFGVVSEVPIQNTSFRRSDHGYYAANWAKDSRAAVFVVGAKWGPAKVWLAKLRAGRVVNLRELTAAVRREVRPDFKKAHAAHFNDERDFIFEGDRQWTVIDSEVVAQAGWALDSAGHVLVDCLCTNDPNFSSDQPWTVHFTGTWDIAKGVFTKKTFIRVPADHLTTHSSEPALRSGRSA